MLMKWVSDAAVVQEEDAEKGHEGEATAVPEGKKVVGMPAEGWEERVGTAATAVLYEMCRVQKLTGEELGASLPSSPPPHPPASRSRANPALTP